MALSMHLYVISVNVPGVPDAMKYATAVVLLGSVLAVNATAIVIRIIMRSRKKW
jgi:phosphate transport system permease protein